MSFKRTKITMENEDILASLHLLNSSGATNPLTTESLFKVPSLPEPIPIPPSIKDFSALPPPLSAPSGSPAASLSIGASSFSGQPSSSSSVPQSKKLKAQVQTSSEAGQEASTSDPPVVGTTGMTLRRSTSKGKGKAVPSEDGDLDGDEDEDEDEEDEKLPRKVSRRRKNTEASVRFRARKKARMEELQRTVDDLEIKVKGLEETAKDLKKQNELLKSLVMERAARS